MPVYVKLTDHVQAAVPDGDIMPVFIHRDILASATASALDRQDHRRAPAWSAILLEVPEGEDGAEEDALLREGLRAAGCPRPQPFTLKQMTHLQLTSATFVHGGVAAISRALARMGVPLPPPDDYPHCLRCQLHRRIWTSSVGELLRHFDGSGGTSSGGGLGAVFVKPLDRRKRFTGFVVAQPDDLASHGLTRRAERLLCASVVRWLTEWRVYVAEGEVLACCNYAGDPALRVEPTVVQEGVAARSAAPGCPAGYALDYGVLDDAGRTTALVEFNDGFGLGAYPGVSAAQYTRLVMSRWQQLLAPLASHS